MGRLFLHIGYPKAGSSALQTALLASRGELRRHGYVYPAAPSGLHNAFTAHFHPRPETLYPYCDIDDATRCRAVQETDFRRLAKRIEQCRRCLILSSESLFDLDAERIACVRDWLANRIDHVTVICYVRHPVAYTSSLIQERVKQGQTLGALVDLFEIGNFRFYTRLIRAWAEAFGKANMIVRPFEREQLAGHDIVTDFAELIGYGGPIDRSHQNSNPSLSHAAALLLSAINELGEEGHAPDWVRRIPGPPFSLPKQQLATFAERCHEHIAYLADEWGVRFGTSAAIPDAPDAFGKEALSFIARQLAT